MGHRYWRIYITAVAGAYNALSEVELRESVGGTDQTGSGTAYASSESFGYAAEAVDNNTSTLWQTSSSVPAWWKYDFGAGIEKSLVEVLLTPRQDYYAASPSAFNIEWSDDNSAWESAASFTHTWENNSAQAFSWTPVLSPATADLEVTEGIPTTAAAPLTKGVSITGGTPVARAGISVNPTSGEISFTGGTPTLTITVLPSSGQMRITGQAPIAQVYQTGNLAVTLPTLAPLFQALGNYAALNVSLPTLIFSGATSSPAWLDVDLPTLVPAFVAGTALTVDLPFPEIQFSAVMGATCALDVDLPTLMFSAGAGAAFALDLPELTPLFSSTTGSVASLNVTLPPFAALFTADVENLAQLVVHLPDLLPAFSSHQQTLGQLIVDLPPLSVLFSGSAGEAASLHVTLPELQILLTSYEEITGQMVVVLPALKALFSAMQSGRFDTATPTQLDGTVLRYRRPV